MASPHRVTAEEWTDDPAVADVVRRVRERCRDGDGHDPLDEAAHLLLQHRGLTGATDLTLASDAGFALTHAGALDLAVVPDSRGQGLGTLLLAAALDQAEPPVTSAWSHGDHPAARVLARRHGFRRSRELWVMRRLLDQPIDVPGPPPNIDIVSYRPEHSAQLLAVNAAAFAEHPEQGDMDAANLAERMAEPWFDPAGLLVAEGPDGRVLGFHWTKRHSPEVGEVYVVGISPAAQGSGLGKALTAAGLAHLRDEGAEQVLLYVEADNHPAVALYSGLGFTHAPSDTHVMYRR